MGILYLIETLVSSTWTGLVQWENYFWVTLTEHIFKIAIRLDRLQSSKVRAESKGKDLVQNF